MSKICIGIFDEHKLVQEGLCSLLADVRDIEVVNDCYFKTPAYRKTEFLPCTYFDCKPAFSDYLHNEFTDAD